MKRSFENLSDGMDQGSGPKHKVTLVESEPEPGGVALVNEQQVSKKTHVELMELEENLHYAEIFNQANATNRLDMIGRQMKNLRDLMTDVINETKLNHELNTVACNFVKKPGHIYHLYQRPTGQKYFGMLSPQEWINAPHSFLGSFRLEVDMSWTPAGQEDSRYEGINFLKDVFSNAPGMKALLSSAR